MSKKVIVIGGGLSGLATAALLAKNNFQVTLFEKNSQLGGRASIITHNNFLFDMGPSWYMMPEIFDDFFSLFNKKTSDFYQLVALNPRYRLYFQDSNTLELSTDLNSNYALFESIESGAGKKLQQFLETNQKIYNLATKKLMYTDFISIKDMINPSTLIYLVKIISHLNPLVSWHSYVSSFFSDYRLQQILEFPAVFLGGNPYDTPAIYSILAWADFGQKIWYPMGGMTKIVDALTTLCRQHGVIIKTNEPVKKIHVDNNRATSVTTQKGKYLADIVIGATDIAHLDHSLLHPDYQLYSPKKWKQQKLSISALLLYLGLDTKIPNIAHHNLYFSKNWANHFHHINSSPTIPPNPCFYLSVPSVTDESVAPANHENLFILVPLGPFNQSITTADEDKIIDHVSKIISFPIADHIIFRKSLDPQGFHTTFNAYRGTALGLSHTLSQSLFFRPKNRHPRIKNLYYVGQYTNPGVGVPIALASAKMVAKRILNHHD